MHGGEEITSPPRIHKEGAIIIEGGGVLEGSMGDIIVEGG